MKAEALALLNGLHLCIDDGCLWVDIEAESLILERVIQKKVQCPYWENNIRADCLANRGCKEDRKFVVSNFLELPRRLRGMLKVEKWSIPNIR